jgi:hypothetical protein
VVDGEPSVKFLSNLWNGFLVYWDIAFGEKEDDVERCEHGHNKYLCIEACRGCGHVCNLHCPECRDVTQRGFNTRDWYCRCPGFRNYPPLDPPR